MVSEDVSSDAEGVRRFEPKTTPNTQPLHNPSLCIFPCLLLVELFKGCQRSSLSLNTETQTLGPVDAKP